MRKVHFFQLSRAMQERLISSVKGTAPPAPILQRKGAGNAHLVYAALAAVALVGLVILARGGYGALGSPSSVQSYKTLAFYALLLLIVPYGALTAVGLLFESRRLPFPPGVYVFPMCLVDARAKRLRVAPMSDLGKVEPATKDAPFRLTYKGIGTFEFPAQGAETAEQLKFQFDVAQEQAKHAKETEDEAELVTLDPFFEPKKFVAPIGPQEPHVERAPVWARHAWLISLGSAVLLAPTIFFVRNARSDDATLARAQAGGAPDAFRSYLAHGRRHREEVESILLPRAELDVAKKQGTVEAVQEFLATHPGSAIDAEAQAALRDAYVAELEKAKALGTVTALEEFARKYPEHHLDQDLTHARHALYVRALGSLKKAAPGLDAAGAALLDRLFAHLEKKGARVVVVFRREISPNLERADKLVGASPLNKTLGPRQVTKHFSEAPNPNEPDVVKALGQTVGKVVPADVLRFEAGPPAGDRTDDAILAETKAPVVVVRYRIGWLGVAFTSTALKRAFAGITVTGEAAMRVPNEASMLKARIDVPSPYALLVKFESAAHPSFNTSPPAEDADPEPAIYATQEMRMLDHVTTALERMILRPAR